MSKYALVLEYNNTVIGFIETEEENPVVGDTPQGNRVVCVRIDGQEVAVGSIYDKENNLFYFPEPSPEPMPAPHPYQPTNAEVAQMISDLQADLLIARVI